MRWDQVVLAAQLATSASEARRLIQQGGIRADGERVVDPFLAVRVIPGQVILVQRGRREFARLRGIPEDQGGASPPSGR